jgi:hypothetical protein
MAEEGSSPGTAKTELHLGHRIFLPSGKACGSLRSVPQELQLSFWAGIGVSQYVKVLDEGSIAS